MTYTEYTDELFTLLENICNDYDYYVMIEAANGNTTVNDKQKEEKKRNIIKSAWIVIKKIINSMIAFAKKIKTKVLVHFKSRGTDANKPIVLKMIWNWQWDLLRRLHFQI